jgi:proline iminopeptidase
VRQTFRTARGLAGWVTGTGPEVLLLHGGPGMTDYMDGMLPELGGYRVASFQQRGVAPSTLDGPYDVPTLRDDVLEVLDTLGWAAPAVIGHSWGGHLLLHVMVLAPERVGAALLVDPLGAVGDGGLAEMTPEVLTRLPDLERARIQELWAREDSGSATDEEVLEAMALGWPAYFSSLDKARPIPQTGHAPADETWASIKRAQPGLAARLAGCRVPTRFLHGDRDPLPLRATEDTAALFDAPVDVLPGVGHFPWLEERGLVRRGLAALLAPMKDQPS